MNLSIIAGFLAITCAVPGVIVGAIAASTGKEFLFCNSKYNTNQINADLIYYITTGKPFKVTERLSLTLIHRNIGCTDFNFFHSRKLFIHVSTCISVFQTQRVSLFERNIGTICDTNKLTILKIPT